MSKRGVKILNLSALIVGILSIVAILIVGTSMKPSSKEKKSADQKIERKFNAQKVVNNEQLINEFAAMKQVDKSMTKRKLKYYPEFRAKNPKLNIPNIPGQLNDSQKLEAEQAVNVWKPYYKNIHKQLTTHKAKYYSNATRSRLHLRHNLLWGFGLIFLVCAIILFASWII